MKLAVALAVVIGSSAFAAPTDEILKERTKKSAYGPASYGGGASYGASYISPCAGGGPIAPIALLGPQGGPLYREEEKEEEHNEQSRSYDGYGAGPISLSSASSGISLAPAGLSGALSLAPAAVGGAIGFFPHSKIGGCSVPLLLSCSPSVVAGHLAKSHGYAAPVSHIQAAYKQAEKQEETTELKEAIEKSWAEAERDASHHGHHHHVVGVVDHHDALGEHSHNHNHEQLAHNHHQHIQHQHHNVHNSHHGSI